MKELKNQNKMGKKMSVEEAKERITNDDIRRVENVTSKYKNKSSEELFGDILNMINEGERNGSLKKQDVSNFASRIAPMLSNEQRSKLNMLLNSIK